ncbi:MAG TPA: heme-binding protein [Thiolinea sp.]|nr:heme-binding protein [Thiolinea sp.]
MMNAVSVTQTLIDCNAAATAVQAAVAEAARLGVKINVAVVDPSGTLMAFLRMPGAPLHSIDIAIDKAYTAVSFGLPTHLWADAFKEHSPAVQDGLSGRPRFVAFGGGLPMVYQGERIGGIGVSGASEAQDQQCAQAGLQAIGMDKG